MKSTDLRKKYLEFFKDKNHAVISPASLIPENDPTVLFTTAGMHPLVPFLMGEKHPSGVRLVDIQPCVRTGDIEEVGDSYHHTFFEMLGNWSLGDYFKKESIEMSYEFLTSKKWLKLDKNRIAISVFAGDQNAPKDEESKQIWLDLGINPERIKELGKEDNWWGPAGETGPCGPDTEIFYWSSKEKVPTEFNTEDKRWVEVWNNVFMEYYKDENGYKPLFQKNVDTGMGLERMLVALNDLDDNYKIDVFLPLIKQIEKLSKKKYEDYVKEFRIIADHIKAATFIIGDQRGIEPSNLGHGYVLRRLIRRAIRYGKRLNLPDNFEESLIEKVLDIYGDTYCYTKSMQDHIKSVIFKEKQKFEKTIEEGLKKAKAILDKKSPIAKEVYFKIMQIPTKDRNEAFIKLYKSNKSETSGRNSFSNFGINIKNKDIFAATVDGKEAFDLYQTYGFPIEMIIELVQEKNLFVDIKDFEEELKKHQELSRTASAGMFKGGLADQGEIATKYHTATHLLLAALRQVLGDHIYQKGSNINAERLRFDFSHPQKMTQEEIKKVEDMVNEKIKENIPVVCEEMSLEEAKNKGAMGVFESKYGEKVKVYTIDNFSKEICGGPHAKNTGELGKFKIVKEESSSSGVRRIKSILQTE